MQQARFLVVSLRLVEFGLNREYALTVCSPHSAPSVLEFSVYDERAHSPFTESVRNYYSKFFRSLWAGLFFLHKDE